MMLVPAVYAATMVFVVVSTRDTDGSVDSVMAAISATD